MSRYGPLPRQRRGLVIRFQERIKRDKTYINKKIEFCLPVKSEVRLLKEEMK
jgi:hypothetical protein